MKSKLLALWQSNPKSWCNRKFFVLWVYETFGPQVKEYLEEKQLPLKCLLVMDNATAHPQDLDLPDGLDFIKVKYLPSNTSSPTHGPTSHLQLQRALYESNLLKVF